MTSEAGRLQQAESCTSASSALSAIHAVRSEKSRLKLNVVDSALSEGSIVELLANSAASPGAHFCSIHFERVHITRPIAELIGKLLTTPHYQLESLTLLHIQWTIDDAKRVCAGIAVNDTLHTLNCSDCPLGNLFVYTCCRAFRSGRLCRLRRLILRGNRINDGAMDSLCPILTAMLPPSHQNGASSDRHRMAGQHSASLPCLRMLDLAYNDITSFGMDILADALKKGVPLVDLNLSANLIVASSITALCQTCATRNTRKATRLRRLALNESGWSLAGIRALCDWLKLSDCSLAALELNDCNLGDDALTELALALGVNTSLRSLHYEGNRFSINPLTLFSEALRINRHLEHLVIDVFEAIIPDQRPATTSSPPSDDDNADEEQTRLDDYHDEAVTALWILASVVRQNATLNTLTCTVPSMAATLCEPMWRQLDSNQARFRAVHGDALRALHVARLLFNCWQAAIATPSQRPYARWTRLPYELLERLFLFVAPLLSVEQLRYILHYALHRPLATPWIDGMGWPDERATFLEHVQCTRPCRHVVTRANGPS